MKLKFRKYQALGNDFILFDLPPGTLTRRRLPRLAVTLCDRHAGVGADGVLWLSPSRKADCRMDIYNADGSWAEKCGNGVRIAAVHLAGRKKRVRDLLIETATSVDSACLVRQISGGYIVRSQLGKPAFMAADVPVRTRRKYFINSPLRIGTVDLPVTCLAVGNPHAVILVDNFDFDWPGLGAEIETARPFPNGTNVEFVQVKSRRKILIAEWERGAGATGSSGTGAAAAVCAMVMLGLTDRRCEAEFETGSLIVDWKADTGIIELTGPVQYVMEGAVEYS